MKNMLEDSCIESNHHAKLRFLKRYGGEISDEQLAAICHLIRQNKVVSLGSSYYGRSEVKIKLGERLVRLIYSAKDNSIITFLPIKGIHRSKSANIKHNERKEIQRNMEQRNLLINQKSVV